MVKSVGNGILKGVGYLAIGSAVAWYSLGMGAAAYTAKVDRSVIRYVANAGNYSVVSESWPQISDWRRWLPPVVDKDGLIITKVSTESGLVQLVDENSNSAIDTANDYVEIKINRKEYRFHGDGTVTEDGDKNTKVNDKRVTSRSEEILSRWNSFLKMH